MFTVVNESYLYTCITLSVLELVTLFYPAYNAIDIKKEKNITEIDLLC